MRSLGSLLGVNNVWKLAIDAKNSIPSNSKISQLLSSIFVWTLIVLACSYAKTNAETVTPKKTTSAKLVMTVTAPNRSPTKGRQTPH